MQYMQKVKSTSNIFHIDVKLSAIYYRQSYDLVMDPDVNLCLQGKFL